MTNKELEASCGLLQPVCDRLISSIESFDDEMTIMEMILAGRNKKKFTDDEIRDVMETVSWPYETAKEWLESESS